MKNCISAPEPRRVWWEPQHGPCHCLCPDLEPVLLLDTPTERKRDSNYCLPLLSSAGYNIRCIKFPGSSTTDEYTNTLNTNWPNYVISNILQYLSIVCISKYKIQNCVWRSGKIMHFIKIFFFWPMRHSNKTNIFSQKNV